MKNHQEVIISDTIAELTATFVKKLQDELKNKPDGEHVSLALAGGSTPKAMFKEIVAKHQNHIDWNKVKVFWSDERCVPPDDEQSNFKMTSEHLLDAIPIPGGNIFRIQGENTPESEAERYSQLVQEQVISSESDLRFDIILLGLGSDGHTASIFPGNEQLFESKQLFVATTHPETGQRRISMTGSLINHAKNIMFLVTGSAKAEVVADVVERQRRFAQYPASLVHPGKGIVTWLLDTEAAKRLNSEQEKHQRKTK